MPILLKRLEKAIQNIDIIFEVYQKFEILLTNIFYKYEHRLNFIEQDILLENEIKSANRDFRNKVYGPNHDKYNRIYEERFY